MADQQGHVTVGVDSHKDVHVAAVIDQVGQILATTSVATTDRGPATAAAQPASRWIIPGLAALGSGTLAALGVWLLYRRRHPAGPSRQGRSRMAH